MNEIYLDHAATTPVLPGVADVMDDVNRNTYFNPSAQYKPSIDISTKINEAKKQIAQALYVPSNDLIFTSSATEANNTIIKGAAKRSHGNFNVITSSIEHPSVMETFRFLEGEGVDVRYVPVDEQGRLDYDWLDENVDEKTTFVSLMGVNNEVGAVTDLVKVRRILDKKNPEALFHTDFVQAFLKSRDPRLDLRAVQPDAITVTAHKINGPKGIGAMYIKNRSKIAALLNGGGQESGYRPGTENVAGILGFAEAVGYHLPRIRENVEYTKKLRSHLLEGLTKISDIVINSPEDGISNILSFSALGAKAEVVLHMLSDKGIYVAAGSACSSKQNKNNYVHKALGYKPQRSEGTIRVSLSEMNTEEQIDVFLEELESAVEVVRRINNFK